MIVPYNILVFLRTAFNGSMVTSSFHLFFLVFKNRVNLCSTFDLKFIFLSNPFQYFRFRMNHIFRDM